MLGEKCADIQSWIRQTAQEILYDSLIRTMEIIRSVKSISSIIPDQERQRINVISKNIETKIFEGSNDSVAFSD